MRFARQITWFVLLVCLIAAIAWLVFSIHGLVHSATEYHVRVLDPVRLGTARPTTAEAEVMESAQVHWGENTMFAIAIVALLAVLLFVSVFLRDRRPTSRRIENR